MLAPRPIEVMHPESPGMRLTVYRRPIVAWLYPKRFATLGEATRHAWAELDTTSPTQRIINMLESSRPLTLSDRLDCPNCQLTPTTTRRTNGSERTACLECGLAVEASNGDSYAPWNQLVECIAGGSGTEG